MDFDSFVKNAVLQGASDIHLAAGNKPAIRLHGKIYFDENEPELSEDAVLACIEQVLSPAVFRNFMETGDADASKSLANYGRFRVNAFRQRAGVTLVMRIINAETPELSALSLPPSIAKVLSLKEGLVLVTGPTGSGKSTTLAALINEINKTKDLHIITIEDPIEYVHTPNRCVINQREIGTDSESYGAALRAVLREDPDVILMGEIRDLESMSIALSAAETGHLVFSTLHTEGAAKTIDRLIDMYPVERQQQALGQLSTTLKAVISQRLLPRADRPGRVGAFEIMFVNAAIANLIRENKIAQIEQMIQLNKNTGMTTIKASIQLLLETGYITPQTAQQYSFDVGSADQVFSAPAPQSMPGAPGMGGMYGGTMNYPR